jgi:hypothetical protein|tara:strand:+ start:1035 stop:2012 length:978 start_codon:yes stop_codon:yes gene_type:complete
MMRSSSLSIAVASDIVPNPPAPRRRHRNNAKANEKAILRRKKKVVELSRRDEACKGYCLYCNRFHSLPRTKEAEECARELIKTLKKRKSVSDETNASDFLVEDVYDEFTGGKMIGILLCETNERTKEKAMLKAFSGQWMGEWEVPGWCPPLAQLTHNSLEYIEEREKIESLSEEIKRLEKKSSSDDVSALVRELKTKRKNTSRALLERIWDSYSLPSFRKDKTRGEASDNSNNSDGSRRKLIELNIRKCYHGDESKLPCGCGDCAAPKLLADCARKGWKPVAIAETWMGPNVKRGAGLREEGVFYGACLERCRPILGHLLCDAEI